MTKSRLAICIPAYERSESLRECLYELLPIADRLRIPVYISDDSASRDVETLVTRELAHFSSLSYRPNRPALRHDRNLIATLLLSDADYVWLLSDSLCVRVDVLPRLIAFLDDQDMVFVNCHADREQDAKAARGADARLLLRDMLWHQTLTGATIYSRRVIDWLQVRLKRPELLMLPNFPQLSVIMGYYAERQGTLGWFGTRSVTSKPKVSYWRRNPLKVFVEDWTRLLLSFPQVILPRELPAVLKSHSARTLLFTGGTLLEEKAKGRFRASMLWRRHFLDAMHLKPFQVILIALMPSTAAALILRLRRQAQL